MKTEELYLQYKDKMQRIADLKYSSAVLQWDQETYLPPKGAAPRGRQIATLSELTHQLFTDEKFGGSLKELSERNDLSLNQKRNVELTFEDYSRNKKYSSEFVRKLAEQVNRTFHSWIQARRKNSFAVFENDLSLLIDLKRQETDILGYVDHPYNALLDEFEKGCTVRFLDDLFKNLMPSLKTLLERIKAKTQVDDSFLKQHFPKDQQWEWSLYLIKQLHFDFEAGRQDLSEHPFTTSFASSDVRITTRIDENDFGNMTWSCIHEAGHALYEQGLPPEQYGLPLGEAASLGIHESQSRLWENNVGRSLAFWKAHYPELQKRFPAQFGKVSLEEFYRAINKVESSFIRTEADEVTYHFHVFIRYEIEKKLIEGSLRVKDLPAHWNQAYRNYLGVDVPNDRQGCLQDVHWSHGSLGYFPTYSLGSLFAAQFFSTIQQQVLDLATKVAAGDTSPILSWLRENVYGSGRKYRSNDLCSKIAGKNLDTTYFVDYLLHKYGLIYNL
jgi:carboxypeptidase Taq